MRVFGRCGTKAREAKPGRVGPQSAADVCWAFKSVLCISCTAPFKRRKDSLARALLSVCLSVCLKISTILLQHVTAPT